jgi:hypothetical protein
MDVAPQWNDQIPKKDGQKLSVNDIAFSPGAVIFSNCLVSLAVLVCMCVLTFLSLSLSANGLVDGQKVLVAVENRVLLYRASDGDLLNSLKGIVGQH